MTQSHEPSSPAEVSPSRRGFFKRHHSVIYLSRTFSRFHHFDMVAWGDIGMRIMTERLVETPRDSFMEAAQREMLAFERKEREFRKREKRERAEELHLPVLRVEIRS